MRYHEIITEVKVTSPEQLRLLGLMYGGGPTEQDVAEQEFDAKRRDTELVAAKVLQAKLDALWTMVDILDRLGGRCDD